MLIVTVIAILALFSIVALVQSAEDTREDHDAQRTFLLWGPFGHR
jgi:hypothetical protein